MAARYGRSDGPELIMERGMGCAVMHFVCKVAVVTEVGEAHRTIATGSIYNVKPNFHKMACRCMWRVTLIGRASLRTEW